MLISIITVRTEASQLTQAHTCRTIFYKGKRSWIRTRLKVKITIQIRKKQCFGSVFILSGSGLHPNPADWVRIQGFDDRKLKKNLQLQKKLNIFFIKHCNLPIQDCIKDIQATEKAFSPQKRTSSTSNMKFLNFFLFCVSFLPS